MHTCTSIDNCPRDLILDQKEVRVKFKKDMIIKGNSVDRKKTLVGTRNMQKNSKMNLAMRGTKY